MIPWRIKEALRPLILSSGIFAFRCGLRNEWVFRWLITGWGNEGWSADTAYLEAVCSWATHVRGPILECGSGLSTILLGIIAPDRVTTLEHLPEWQERVQQTAAHYSIGINVVTAPLINHGEFDWYCLPESAANDYELVICDGPPSATRGGRYGLLPVVKRRLAQDAIILMDDVERPDERDIIERWEKQFSVSREEHRTASGAYAIVRAARTLA